MTKAEKITISIPASMLEFVTEYQENHQISRSEVIQQALKSLREAELAQAYRDAAEEMRNDPLFDLDPSHGLKSSTEENW